MNTRSSTLILGSPCSFCGHATVPLYRIGSGTELVEEELRVVLLMTRASASLAMAIVPLDTIYNVRISTN